MAKPTVTIPEAEYKELLADSNHLNMLVNRGVDNWDGYVGRGHEECEACGFDEDDCECGGDQ